MCLKTSFRGRNNPKTDINCYKVLIHLNGKILAPFTRYEYKLDEVLIDTAEERPSLCNNWLWVFSCMH